MGKALADHLIALKANRLRRGMYVAALDRLWLHTPFPPDGFYLRNDQQIAELGRYCSYVYIDPLKCEEPDDVVVPFEPISTAALAPRNVQHDVADEIPWARQALKATHSAVRTLIQDVRNGEVPQLASLHAGLLPMVDSVQRSPDALIWLLRTEALHGHLYRRAVGTSVTATVFGHRLGFDEDTLMELALGGVLLDIGKIALPVPILAKPQALTPEEHGLVKRHVDHALTVVREIPHLPERSIDMVSSHHERFDGSGYPFNQRGTEIPLFARIAGIVDTFDALTLERHYAPAISAHNALRYLDGQRKAKFDGALMQEFVQAVGIYPTGTWVELLDGTVGVVCAQDRRGPLAPRVAVISDANHQPLAPRIVAVTRANPIINARHRSDQGMMPPDLEAIA